MLSYEIKTSWNGSSIEHPPIKLEMMSKAEGMHLHIHAPYFNDTPPTTPPGEPLWKLWDFEGRYWKIVSLCK